MYLVYFLNTLKMLPQILYSVLDKSADCYDLVSTETIDNVRNNPVINRWQEQAKLKKRSFPSDCYHDISLEHLEKLFFFINFSTQRVIFDLFRKNGKVIKKITNRKIHFEQINPNRFRIHEIGFCFLLAQYLFYDTLSLLEMTEEFS